MRKRFPRFVQDSSRGDDGLEGENPERARECIFARKRFPATLSGICGGDDELERADSERARKQIRMRKGFPSSPRGKKKGPRRERVETLSLEGMTGIEPA